MRGVIRTGSRRRSGGSVRAGNDSDGNKEAGDVREGAFVRGMICSGGWNRNPQRSCGAAWGGGALSIAEEVQKIICGFVL